MNALLIYMVKAALYLAGFYLIYFIFLSRDTKYSRNRAFIILSVSASFILPLISVNINEHSGIYYFGKTLSEVLVTANGRKGQVVSASGNDLINSSIFFKFYFAGIIAFGLKVLTDLINLLVLISQNKKANEHIIYFKGFNTAGFSAMGYIFISRSLDKVEAEEIIRHEQNHLEKNHFLDILFIEVIMIFQWFNPFIYLFNRSLRAIHEYQADQSCIKSGMPVTNYQNLLLSNVFRSRRINISNSFSNPSLIKKRMIMMSKKPSGNFSSLKLLLVIPIVVLFIVAISACEKSINMSKSTNEISSPESPVSQTIEIIEAPVYHKPAAVKPVSPPPPPPPVVEQSKTTSTEKLDENIPNRIDPVSEEVPGQVFVVAEEMPTFPGGDKAMMNFIYANIVYPEIAKENNIQGRVILKFCVTYKGTVDKVTILKSVDSALDNEAIRVIKMLPTWKPGKQGGKPVNVWYNVPVIFQLK